MTRPISSGCRSRSSTMSARLSPSGLAGRRRLVEAPTRVKRRSTRSSNGNRGADPRVGRGDRVRHGRLEWGEVTGQAAWMEADLWVHELGMDPRMVIRSMTLDAARMMGAERESGSISQGKFADVIAVAAIPCGISLCCATRRLSSSTGAGTSSRRFSAPSERENAMDKRFAALSVAMAACSALAMGVAGQGTAQELQLVTRAAEALGGRERVMALKTLQIVGYGEFADRRRREHHRRSGGAPEMAEGARLQANHRSRALAHARPAAPEDGFRFCINSGAARAESNKRDAGR